MTLACAPVYQEQALTAASPAAYGPRGAGGRSGARCDQESRPNICHRDHRAHRGRRDQVFSVTSVICVAGRASVAGRAAVARAVARR